jgi:hypothetical protein
MICWESIICLLLLLFAMYSVVVLTTVHSHRQNVSAGNKMINSEKYFNLLYEIWCVCFFVILLDFLVRFRSRIEASYFKQLSMKQRRVKKHILVVFILSIFYFLNRSCHALLHGIIRPKSYGCFHRQFYKEELNDHYRYTLSSGSPCPRTPKGKKVRLHSIKKERDENINKKERIVEEYRNLSDRLSLVDSTLIYTDIFAIVIACQLMGLIDVLNNPIFWENGGWIQPILLADSTSTLPIFLQRVAVNSVSYICSTFCFVAGAYQVDCALQTPLSISRITKSSMVVFTIVRLGIWIGIVLITQQSSMEYNDDIFEKVVSQRDGFSELLRECYFIATTTTAGRLALFKFSK